METSARRSVFVLLAVATLAVGCRSDGRTLQKPAADPAPTGLGPSTTGLSSSGVFANPASSTTSAAASPRRAMLKTGTTNVFRDAARTGSPTEVLTVPNEFSKTMALPLIAEDRTAQSIQVELPGRQVTPQLGWIASSDAVIDSSPQTVTVDPIRKRLTVYTGTEIVFEEPVGIGSAYSGISGTRQFVIAVVSSPSGEGVLGTVGVAGSRTTTAAEAFVPGDAQVVIHGIGATSTVDAVGAPGMVRLSNDAVARVTRIVLPGTRMVFQSATP